MDSKKKESGRVVIFDTTLRDGEQAPGASMTIPEKVEMAKTLARLGVDVIEAGFPVSSPAQFEAVRRIVDEVQGPTICALARATEQDIRRAAEALEGGANTRIHTFIATSDIHLESKFGHDRYGKTLAEKRDTVKRMAADAVRFARTFTDDVEFSAEDAGRSEIDYLVEVVQTAVDAGATTINIPDTTGYCTPSEYAMLFEELQRRCAIPDHVVLSTHCHDDLGLAVANSLAGVHAGARQIECTINGIGERAGNAALEEVVMTLRVRADHFGLHTDIDAHLLAEASKMVSTFTGFAVQPNKAIVGRNAFSHEAGIHQDGVLKRRDTYEIMRAEDVGQSSEAIRLGRHSGRHGLFNRLERLGLSVDESEKAGIYERFVDLADRKKEVNDQDLYYIVGEQRTGASEAHLTLGEIYLRQGDLDAAEKELRAELANYPQDLRTQQLLAMVLDLAGKSEEAMELLEVLVEKTPQSADARYLMGKILLAEGDAQRAQIQLESAARLAPEDPEAHYQLGLALQRLGRTEEAKREFATFQSLKKAKSSGDSQ